MTLALDENSAKYQIRSYKPGIFRVNEQIIEQSIIIAADQLIDHWEPQHISELRKDHLAVIAEMKPSILLIGTGEKLQFPPIELYGDLINKGIGVEIMDTNAACRTFTALTAEGRNVVAALLVR